MSLAAVSIDATAEERNGKRPSGNRKTKRNKSMKSQDKEIG